MVDVPYTPRYALPKLWAERLPSQPFITHGSAGHTIIRDKEGFPILNPVKKYLRPYWLTVENGNGPAPNIITLPSTTVNPEPSRPFTLPIDNQGPLEIYYLEFQSDFPDFTIQIFDPEYRRLLMNREIHIRSIGGTAEAPFIWQEPLLLHPENEGKAITIVLRNLVNQTNNVRIVFHGRRIFHYESPANVIKAWAEYSYNRRWTHPYFLTTETALISPPGAPAFLRGFIRNPDDADFEWMKFSQAVVNRDGNPKEDYELRILEQANQRTFMNNFILDTLAAGDNALSPFPTGVLPFSIWEPTYFERNYKLQVQLQELANDSQEYFLTFFGRKIYHAK